MRIEFTLTAKDAYQAGRAIEKAKDNRLHKAVILFVMVAPFVLKAAWDHSHGLDIDWMIPMFVILPFAFGMAFLVHARRSRAEEEKRCNRNPDFPLSMWAQLDEKGFISTTSTSRTEDSWQAFDSYLQTPEALILVRTSGLMFNILPKRAFGSQEQLDQAITLLESHIGTVFPKRRSHL